MPANPARYVSANSHDMLIDFGQDVCIYCVHAAKWLYVQSFDSRGRLLAGADSADLKSLSNRTRFRILRNQLVREFQSEVLSSPDNNRIALQSVFNGALLHLTPHHSKFSLAVDYSNGRISNRHLVTLQMAEDMPANAHMLPECGIEVQPAYTVY